MVLYLIGLGLGDEKDITLKGLEAIQQCDKVYLENYTSLLGVNKDKLEILYGKKVEILDREAVESEFDIILKFAENLAVAFLVVGDPFGATTHTDVVLRAKAKNIELKVIHNASIMNAVGVCGLQLYKFGQTVSIPFFTNNWRPYSFYDKITENRKIGLHTLCLLDIKVKEQSEENLLKGKKIYEPARFMTINQAINQLLEAENSKQHGVYSKDTLCVGLARVGQESQKIVFGKMNELIEEDFGSPLHSFIITGEVHPSETDMLQLYKVKSI